MKVQLIWISLSLFYSTEHSQTMQKIFNMFQSILVDGVTFYGRVELPWGRVKPRGLCTHSVIQLVWCDNISPDQEQLTLPFLFVHTDMKQTKHFIDLIRIWFYCTEQMSNFLLFWIKLKEKGLKYTQNNVIEFSMNSLSVQKYMYLYLLYIFIFPSTALSQNQEANICWQKTERLIQNLGF